MPLRQSTFSLTVFRGLDIQTDPMDASAAFATSCNNVSFSRKPGAVMPSYGYSRIIARNPGGGTGTCLGFHYFMRSDGTRMVLARGPRGYYCRQDGTSTWTTLLEWFSSTPWAVPHFVPYYSRLWVADGVGIWSWDGRSAFTPYVGSTAAKRQWPPWGCQLICKHFERLWIGGYKWYPGRIIYSNVGATSPSTATNTVAFSTTNLFNIGRQDRDDPVTALLPQEGQVSNLLVFKRRSMWTIAGNDAATFDIDMLSRTGCVGSRAAAMTPQGAFWLDKGQVYWFDGVRPINSVAAPLANTLYARTKAHPGVVNNVFVNDDMSAKANFLFQTSANWVLGTSEGSTHYLRALRTLTTSTQFGWRASVPCPNRTLHVRFKLPTITNSASKQRIFIKFLCPTVLNSTDRRGYGLTYSYWRNSAYQGASLAAKYLVLGKWSTAGGNFTKIGSVLISASPGGGWWSVSIDRAETALQVYWYMPGGGTKFIGATDSQWLDPRSTMFDGIKVVQHASVAANTSAARVHYMQEHMVNWNTGSQVAYCPADKTLHIATASSGYQPDGKPLAFDLITQDWATRDYSVATYGNHESAVAGNGLAVALRGASATDGKFRLFDKSSGYYGRYMSSYWRSNWVAGHAESAQQLARELHVHYAIWPTKRMHVFLSSAVNPFPDRARTQKGSFLMGKSPLRWNVNLPGPFFRVTLCAVGSSTSSPFNVSRVNFVTNQMRFPSRWER